MNDFFSPRYSYRGRSKHQAFSLLEVAFALVIFVIGAIALLRIFPGGLGVLEDSGNRRVAAQMSQNVVTSYNSGDLASTTPDAIYHVDQSGGPTNGNWDDYPLSAFGLRRQKGTLPEGPDDFNSAKDALNHIRGEKQGISNGVVYTNYVADGKVDIFRAASVKKVSILRNGVIDFRNAVYSDSQRSDKPTLPFREPILNIVSIVDENGVPVALNGDTAVIQRATVDKNYIVTFRLDDVSITTGISSTVDASSFANKAQFTDNGTGCTSTVVTPAVDTATIQLSLKVPAITSTPQSNQIVTYTFDPTVMTGVSVARALYSILIASDATGIPAPVSGPLLPVRAPLEVRKTTGIKFYVSYNWTDDATVAAPEYEGVVDMPATLPTDDTTDAKVPFNVTGNAAVVATSNATLSFKQPLGTANVAGDRVKLNISASPFSDSDSTSVPITQLTQVSLDYNVRGWEYISEDVSEFGTPFSGNDPINSNTPEGLAQLTFMSNAGYTGNIPMSELREIRTRLPNLRGPIYIKGFYDQSIQPLDIPLFDLNTSTFPTGVTSTVSPQAYVRQKRALGKQGRLYVPANVVSGSDMKALSHARVYYRSSDAWAQQVGVTASHYLPYDLMKALPAADQENWRQYYHGNDGYLYFHASEAGKTVECLYGTDPNDLSTSTLEISPDVLYVGAMPADVPAAFANKAFPTTAGDARSGKFYLARSRDRIPTAANIFDIRRPEGTSGILVRTMWLNNDRYAQEVAQ